MDGMSIGDISINLQRVSGPPAEGVHYCRIVNVDVKPGQKAPYLRWQLKIEERSDDNGKNVFDNTSLSPEARFRIENLLDAAGMPTYGNLQPRALIGKRVRIQVVHSEYQNNLQANVKRYLACDLAEGEMGGGSFSDGSVMPEETPALTDDLATMSVPDLSEFEDEEEPEHSN